MAINMEPEKELQCAEHPSFAPCPWRIHPMETNDQDILVGDEERNLGYKNICLYFSHFTKFDQIASHS